MRDKHSEVALIRIHGQHRTMVRRVVDGVTLDVVDTGWADNLVVTSATTLIAGLLCKEATFTDQGLLQHALGSGDPAWDTGGTPTPPLAQTVLEDEVIRKAVDYVIYIDPITNLPVAPGTYTNKIETRTTFEFTDGPPSGFWIREHGLFGGNATSTADTGILFNVANHLKIWKDQWVEITRYFRHEISLA